MVQGREGGKTGSDFIILMVKVLEFADGFVT